MDSTQLLVTLAGAALIGLVVWFFFFVPHRIAAAVSSSGGVRQVDITN